MVTPNRAKSQVVEIPFAKSAWLIIAGAVFLICVATLSPFDFNAEGVSLKFGIANFIVRPAAWWDVIGNVFLFMPFGFGLAAWLKSGKVSSRLLIFTVALLASTLFSFAVETLQLFLSSRSSSWIDVLTNTTGGALGSVTYLWWCATSVSRSQFLNQKVRPYLTIPTVTGLLIGWVLLTCVTCISLQKAAQLGNWQTNFPLLVGNERTADRPWEGTVSLIEISDRALSEPEIATVLQSSTIPQPIASYALTGTGNFRDRAGNSPDLVWQGTQPAASPTGASIAAQHWLATQKPANDIAQKLRKTSEFTIHAIAAAANSTQAGPARIVSLSADPLHRNFTLGQEQDQLVFRLRTPITGENGVFTALFIPNIFRDHQLHHFLIRYQDNVISIYIDQVQTVYDLALTPELTLFRYLFPFEGQVLRLSDFSIQLYKVMFQAFFFVPLGMIVALMMAIVKGQLKFYVLLGILGVLFPAFLLEFLLKSSNLRFGSILLSVAIASVTLLLIKGRFNRWLSSTSIL